MKKIISALLIFTLLLSALVSCGDRKYDENEVKEAAVRLISDSGILNDIFWGSGLPHTDDKNTADGSYYEAYYAYHKGLGFETLDELMVIAEKTFTKEYCNYIRSTVLASIEDGDEVMNLARYYQKVSLSDGRPESIMVNSECDQLIIGTTTYDYNSLEVIGSEKETVYVTISATVTLEDYEPQTKTIKIALIEEDNGWRINSPTYLSYDKTNLNK